MYVSARGLRTLQASGVPPSLPALPSDPPPCPPAGAVVCPSAHYRCTVHEGEGSRHVHVDNSGSRVFRCVRGRSGAGGGAGGECGWGGPAFGGAARDALGVAAHEAEPLFVSTPCRVAGGGIGVARAGGVAEEYSSLCCTRFRAFLVDDVLHVEPARVYIGRSAMYSTWSHVDASWGSGGSNSESNSASKLVRARAGANSMSGMSSGM